MFAGQNNSHLKMAAAVAGLALLFVSGAGCKKSSNDNTQAVQARDGRASVAPPTPISTNPQTGQTYTTASSYVTTDSGNNAAFQTALKSLVSGQMDPQYLGNVSATDGVILRAYIEVDQSGHVVPQTSRISIEIRDEYANQTDSAGNRIPPVTLTLPASSGYAYNGKAQLVFTDSIGRIEIYGSYSNGGSFSGNVWFANTRKFDGSTVNAQLSGLGNFQVQTCGFFKCY